MPSSYYLWYCWRGLCLVLFCPLLPPFLAICSCHMSTLYDWFFQERGMSEACVLNCCFWSVYSSCLDSKRSLCQSDPELLLMTTCVWHGLRTATLSQPCSFSVVGLTEDRRKQWIVAGVLFTKTRKKWVKQVNCCGGRFGSCSSGFFLFGLQSHCVSWVMM
jgi:hypothetical protein